jgi:hypothetical protein
LKEVTDGCQGAVLVFVATVATNSLKTFKQFGVSDSSLQVSK